MSRSRRRPGLAAAFWVWLGSLIPLGAAAASPETPARASWFESDAAPVPVTVTGNPLDYAAERIGLDLRNLELPRAWEGGYRLACNFPIIDAISYRPLYMKQWAEQSTDRIQAEQERNGLLTVGLLIDLLERAQVADRPPQSASFDAVRGDTGCADREALRLRSPLLLETLDALEQGLAEVPLTPEYRRSLAYLCCRLTTETDQIRRATSKLAPEDSAYFAANPGRFLAPDGTTMPDLTGNVSAQFEFIERARLVPLREVLRAAGEMSHTLEAFRRAQAEVFSQAGLARSDRYLREPGALAQPLVIPTPFGDFVLAGPGNDRHERDAWILIDLGGDDTYLNNAGGCARAGQGAAILIDHGGDDLYDAGERPYTQGFGFLGAGFLLDLGGDDRYHAQHFAQGTGILGTGVVADFGGNDRYDAAAVCQGAALFGLGAILDSEGDDLYDCATIGQGAATTLGLGVLSDLGGADRYLLGVDSTKSTLGQGAGFGQGGALSFRHYPWTDKLTAYGGVGLLNDAAGNDHYESHGWCDQGGSYILSLGVLNDGDGNDHYLSRTGQGSGIHVTNAILIDSNGDDTYEGVFRSGGSGGDRSPGFLIDYHGNDVYKSTSSSFGTACKPYSCSLLIDYEGNDLYQSEEPKGEILMNCWDSFGGVWPESEPHAWPYAIHLDLGGDDTYRVRNRANNSERLSFGHGIHLDCEWSGGDVIGTVERPIGESLPYLVGSWDRSLERAEARWAERPLTRLGSVSLFDAFQAVQPLVDGEWWQRRNGGAGVDTVRRAPGEMAAMTARMLRHCADLGYSRRLMECWQYFLTRRQVGPNEAPAMQALLTARVEEVRAITAYDLGYWRIPGSDSVLVTALRHDPSSRVRRSAADALARLKSPRGVADAAERAVLDPSADVRRVCLRYLGTMGKEAAKRGPGATEVSDLDLLTVLTQALGQDPDPVVRVAACEALGDLSDPRALTPLRTAAASDDIYLQRAAARGLARLGEVEAIDLLIRSLEFPSIDAFYNYGKNVPNTIAAYCGHELPEAERYDRRNWRTWFDAHRDEIDVAENAAASDDLNDVTATYRDSSAIVRVREHERFLDRHPRYVPARKQIGSMFNLEAWKLAITPADSPAHDPATALAWARRAVELDPQPDYIDTLVEALLANGRTDEAVAACEAGRKQHPDNEALRRRWESMAKGR